MLKACLNGGRDRDAHPAVPLTPAELAADAARCAALGVAAVHVHPRDAAGVESLRPEVIADALTAIRAARPGLPVGVSTGAWIEPDPAARVAAVRAWPVLPDFASVNAHEAGAEAVAAALHERGVLVEAGLWTLDAVEAYRRWRVPAGRILVECMAEDVPVAVADAARILAALPSRARRIAVGGTLTARVAHRCCCTPRARPPGRCSPRRSAVGCTPASGWRTRCCLPDGTPAPGNAALVTAALAAGAR